MGKKFVNVYNVLGDAKFNKFFLKIFLILFVAGVCDGYALYIFGITTPYLMADLGYTAVQAGVINSFASWSMAASTAILGMLADKIGRKRIITFCVIMFTVFTAVTGLCTTMMQFAVARILSGIGLAGFVPAMIADITEYSPRKNRALIVAVTGMGVTCGMIVAGLAGLFLLPAVNNNWRVLYYICFVAILMVVICAVWLPESMAVMIHKGHTHTIGKVLREADPSFNASENVEFIVDTDVSKKIKVPVSRLFQQDVVRNTLLLWVMYFCNMIIIFGTGTWLPGIMAGAGYEVSSGILLFLFFSLGGIIVGPLGGKFVNKFGYKKVMAVLYIVTALCLVCFGFAKSMVLSSIMIFIAGGTSNGGQLLIQPFNSHFFPAEVRSTAVGWGVTMGRLGGIVGPLLGGLLVGANVSLQADFIIFAGIVMVALVALLLTKENGKQL